MYMKPAKCGRPQIEVAANLFEEQVKNFRDKKVTAEQAAAALGISRITFFRRLKAQQPTAKAE